MTCFAFDFFEHFPACFITMEELFGHLPLVEYGHQRLKQALEAVQSVGDRALG